MLKPFRGFIGKIKQLTPLKVKMSETKINEEDFQIIKEGKATILAPKEDKVFYNPIQQFNRDLSITGIKAWTELYKESKEGTRELKKRKLNSEVTESPKFIRILEALSATGLRAIRYGHEIPHVSKIIANDLLGEAVKSINRNIEYNKLDSIIDGNQGDAIKYMSSLNNKDNFHIIDLDPYGTATPFIDGAIQSIKDEGMLLVTCTDAGVLAGSGYPEKCFALYGGNNFGNTFMGNEMNHEVGIRLILGMISREAAKYKKSIEPMLCLSIDFYFRLFIKVKTSPQEVKKLSSNTMITYHCTGCGDNLNQPLGRITNKKFQLPRMIPINQDSKCKYCESYYNIAGPMWLENIQNETFMNKILEINDKSDTEVYKTRERIRGMVTLAKQELRDQPFYFNLNQLNSFIKSPPMPIDNFVKAIGNLGKNYKVSLTHAKKNCLKTDAPWETILKINNAWLIRENEKLLKQYEDKLNKDDEESKNEKLIAKYNKLKENPNTNPNLTEGMIGFKILKNLKNNDDVRFDFDTENELSSKIDKLRKVKLVRYQENPTKNWGPKSRPSS